MSNPILKAGSLGIGQHFTARDEVKQRPGTATGELVGGAMSFFWGSRDQRYRFPKDALEANPDAPEDSEEFDLFDALRCVLDQRTFFHGLMVCECPLREFDEREGMMPPDYWLRLVEQRDAARLSFAAAWKRLGPLMQHRFKILDGLWRGNAPAPLLETTVLTLMLCDGWCPSSIAGLEAVRAVERNAYVELSGERLMPYTGYLILRCKQDQLTFPASDAAVLDCAEVAWDAACGSAYPQKRLAPPWERARNVFVAS